MIQRVLNGRVPWQICVDPIAFIPNPVDGRCYADVFIENGLNVVPAPKELSTGIQKAKQELVRENNIFIMSSCSETIKEFYTYCWDKDKEKPVDKNDHMMECFYRACVVGLNWVDGKSETISEGRFHFSDETLNLSPFANGDLTALAA